MRAFSTRAWFAAILSAAACTQLIDTAGRRCETNADCTPSAQVCDQERGRCVANPGDAAQSGDADGDRDCETAAFTACVNGDVYSFDSCNRQESLVTDCAPTSVCRDLDEGNAQCCVPDHHLGCNAAADAVHRVDSCGFVGDKVEDCMEAQRCRALYDDAECTCNFMAASTEDVACPLSGEDADGDWTEDMDELWTGSCTTAGLCVACALDADCAADGHCVCGNPDCTYRLCSQVDCSCSYNANRDAGCDGNVTSGVHDSSESCDCDGAGNCL